MIYRLRPFHSNGGGKKPETDVHMQLFLGMSAKLEQMILLNVKNVLKPVFPAAN